MTLQLTESAQRRIQTLLQEDSEKKFFRIMVSGGGCSGFQYSFSLEGTQGADDQVFDLSGVSIIVDEASLPFLENVTLDFVEDLMGASFQVQNPNATSTCGCKNSFSI